MVCGSDRRNPCLPRTHRLLVADGRKAPAGVGSNPGLRPDEKGEADGEAFWEYFRMKQLGSLQGESPTSLVSSHSSHALMKMVSQ
jgi:hypothetical protein